MRTVFVGAGRLERWVDGFGDRHPGVTVLVHDDRVELAAPDGSTATLYPTFGTLLGHSGTTPGQAAAALVADARAPEGLRALLIRRGGYACAVLAGDAVVASKVGSRYVQGRTAAGGWSQQRFARRRQGQVHGLVGSTSDVAARILLPVAAGDALITGGDRPLVEQVLADPRLAPLAALRRGPHLEIGDPKRDLVGELPERARAIRITLDERPG